MPKDKRTSVSSFDRRIYPYSRTSKISDPTNLKTYFPQSGIEKDWEEARCPICMDHPHNPVLLICSSREKGCRPFICDTSYRHSNCFDQLQKSAPSQSQILCPLCRGTVTGKEVISPARILMNSKTRNCSLETCNFNGNYVELRKHARRAHPFERPSEAIPSRQSDWALLEEQTRMDDAMVHRAYPEDEFATHASFERMIDFLSGMPYIEDNLFDELFGYDM